LKLENGSEFTVEKELGDYIHQLEQTVRGVLNTHNCMCGLGKGLMVSTIVRNV
jgi:hypothetical protein